MLHSALIAAYVGSLRETPHLALLCIAHRVGIEFILTYPVLRACGPLGSGKYLNGYHGSKGHWATYIPPGWTDWFGFQTVDFFGTQVNMNGNSTKFPETAYQTDIIANLSIAWLRYAHDRSKPMFMMLTPHAPHEPYTPAPRHLGTLSGLVQPDDPAFNMPDALQKLLPGNLGRLPNVSSTTMNGIYERRAESLLAVDEMIGGVLDELAAQDALGNTYFFFSCDNG